MRTRILYIFAFLLIVAGSLSLVWLLKGDSKTSTELPIADAISRIDKGDFKEVRFTSGQVEFIDLKGKKFVTQVGSDATREQLELRVHEFMEAGPEGKTMKITVEPASVPLSWILITTVPYALIFIGIGLALGLLLSRFIRK